MIPVRIGSPEGYVLQEVSEAQFEQHKEKFVTRKEPVGVVMPGAGGQVPMVEVYYFPGTVDEFSALFGPSGVVGPVPPPVAPPPPIAPKPASFEAQVLALLREIHEDIHKLAAMQVSGIRRNQLGPVDEPGK